MMHGKLATLIAAVAMGAAAVPADARISYLFSSNSIYFQFFRSNYISLPTTYSPTDVEYCGTFPDYSCISLSFTTGTDIFNAPSDVMTYTINNSAGTDLYTQSVHFTRGAFSKSGSYSSNYVTNGAGFTLAIAGTPDAATVPEPAAWALMIIGFGAIGGASRVRRVRDSQPA